MNEGVTHQKEIYCTIPENINWFKCNFCITKKVGNHEGNMQFGTDFLSVISVLR